MSSETTENPKPVSKWKDPEFIRTYYREKRRLERGIKRHPNIMEDGSKYSDHRPYGRFDTKEEFEANRKKYQKPAPKRPKTTCPICGVEVYEAKWWVHEKSIPHQKNIELLKRHGVVKNEDISVQG